MEGDYERIVKSPVSKKRQGIVELRYKMSQNMPRRELLKKDLTTGYIYGIQIFGTTNYKIGMSRAYVSKHKCREKLRKRYQTYYGPNIDIKIYKTANIRAVEKNIHAELAAYRLGTSEIFNIPDAATVFKGLKKKYNISRTSRTSRKQVCEK